jgi:hypothetical protein
MTALDNARVRLRVDPQTGGLVELAHPGLGIDLVGEPRLAEGWRLLAHLPGGFTTLRAVDQPAPQVNAAGDELELTWTRLATPDGEVEATVRQRLRLDGDTLTARLEIDNRSPHLIEEAYPLCVGGMARHGADGEDWRMLVPGLIFGGEEWAFYREFPGKYLGFRRSSFAYAYPGASVDYWQQNLCMPWVSLYDEQRRVGVSFSNLNPEIAFSAFWGELAPQPDFASPKARALMLWPDPDRVQDDVPVGATTGWAFFPFLAEGVWESPPVVVRFHEGTWREAARHYRGWFDEHVGTVTARRDGLAARDAWQNTYLETPGGRIRYRFEDIPKLGRDAQDAGIDVIMVGGYHQGGLDTSYPRFSTPSERLGTADDLRAGIAACQEQGVDVLLFANANQVSLDAPDYDERLSAFVNQRPDGRPHLPIAFGFDRLLSFMGISVPHMVSGNLVHDELREMVMGGWRDLVGFGPRGIQIDKLIAGEPYNLDFNPEAPGHPMSNSHRALVAAVAEFAAEARARDVAPWIALETAWDRLMPYAEVLYCRFFGTDHVPVQEVTFPEVKATCCVCGQFDFGLVNNCVRYGHVIALEGDYLWGTSADVPAIVPYVREVLRMRRGLMDNLWWAAIVEPDFADIDAPAELRVGAFEAWDEAPETGTRHALVLHHFEAEPLDVRIGFAEPYTRAVVHRPFAPPQTLDAPVDLRVARDEVVVVLPVA